MAQPRNGFYTTTWSPTSGTEWQLEGVALIIVSKFDERSVAMGSSISRKHDLEPGTGFFNFSRLMRAPKAPMGSRL